MDKKIIIELLKKQTVMVDKRGQIWRKKKLGMVRAEEKKYPNKVRAYINKQQLVFTKAELAEVAFQNGLQIEVPKVGEVLFPRTKKLLKETAKNQARRKRTIPDQGVHKKQIKRGKYSKVKSKGKLKKQATPGAVSPLDSIVEALKAMTAAQIQQVLDQQLQALVDKPLAALATRLDEEVKQPQSRTVKNSHNIAMLSNANS